MDPSAPPPLPASSTMIQLFIDNGALTRAIEQANFFINEKIAFVSFSADSGVVRVLIAGSCALCGSRHMRNICNSKYCNECISPILRRLFPIIQSVVVVRSDDANLGEIVETNGGRVSTPFPGNRVTEFVNLNRFCLDQHPEIDGFVKTLSVIDWDVRPHNNANSRDGFTDMYMLCWSVMDSTAIISTNGLVLKGRDQILAHRNNLPIGVEIVEDPTQRMVMLGVTGRGNFAQDRYKCLSF